MGESFWFPSIRKITTQKPDYAGDIHQKQIQTRISSRVTQRKLYWKKAKAHQWARFNKLKLEQQNLMPTNKTRDQGKQTSFYENKSRGLRRSRTDVPDYYKFQRKRRIGNYSSCEPRM